MSLSPIHRELCGLFQQWDGRKAKSLGTSNQHSVSGGEEKNQKEKQTMSHPLGGPLSKMENNKCCQGYGDAGTLAHRQPECRMGPAAVERSLAVP